MCLGIAVYILKRVRSLQKLRKGGSSGKRSLYSSDEDRHFMGRM